MSKHTPGPWEAVEHTANTYPLPAGVCCRVVKQGGHRETDTICEMVGQGNGKYESNVTNANAHLIAAAPKMLEALRDGRDELCKLYDRLSIHNENPVVLRSINAAIAKAEGRT